jgi:DNA-binding GntR family transcriptional regulator
MSTAPTLNAGSSAKRVQRQALSGQVADDLRKRILSGELPQGLQLKQEALAAEFGISKVPVREALHQLEAEGFIIQKFHRGAIVAGLSPGQIMELFEFRAEIEVWLMGLAMRKATELDFAAAAKAARLIERSDNPATHPELNWKFHEALYLPAKREYALDIVRKIHHKIDRYVRLQFTLVTHKEQVVREHLELLKLYKSRSAEAKSALRQHIVRAADQLSLRLRNRDDSTE